MTLVWTILGVLALVAGVRYRQAVRQRLSGGAPVDDAAVQRIIQEGTFATNEDPDALDLTEAAEAEEEFWSEYWDEPDEYQP